MARGGAARAGYSVTEQPIERGCANVLATLDDPAVVFSTHFDCVPPFFPSRVADGRLYGRGACDAKGILAAQVAAAERLRGAGERRVGLLFVVGEERGSDGAAAANTIPNRCRVPDQRRADRQPPGDGDARRAARPAARARARRAFRRARAGRVGDREAARRAGRAAFAAAADRPRPRIDVLHRRTDRGRRRPERHPGAARRRK